MGSNFQTMGYESSSILDNIGMLALAIVAFAAVGLFLMIFLRLLAKKFEL
jgi:hypothetical protein